MPEWLDAFEERRCFDEGAEDVDEDDEDELLDELEEELSLSVSSLDDSIGTGCVAALTGAAADGGDAVKAAKAFERITWQRKL